MHSIQRGCTCDPKGPGDVSVAGQWTVSSVGGVFLLHRLRVEASYPTVSVASVVPAPITVTGRGAGGKVAGHCFVDFSALQPQSNEYSFTAMAGADAQLPPPRKYRHGGCKNTKHYLKFPELARNYNQLKSQTPIGPKAYLVVHGERQEPDRRKQSSIHGLKNIDNICRDGPCAV